MGLFIDTKNRCFYLILFPTVVIKIQYRDSYPDSYPKDHFGYEGKESEEGDVYFVEDKSVFGTEYIVYKLEDDKWSKQ